MRFARLISIALPLLAAGCGSVTYRSSGDSGGDTKVGELQTDPVRLENDGIKKLDVSLKMGVGDLDVAGAADAAPVVDGKLEYNVPSWKPVVTESRNGDTASLKIETPPGSKSVGGNTKYRWSLQVSNQVPVTFEIESGVGKSKLNLGAMKLRGVTLNVGVGATEVDLRGKPDESYDADIHGGVGESTVFLPSEADIKAEVETGIGAVKVEGLEKHGDVWESPGMGKAKVKITLKVEGGIGRIRIVRSEAAN